MLGIYISIFFFLGWLLYILIRYGIQPSISDSYYRLTTANQWLFTISTWGYVIPLSIAGAQVATDGTYLIMILATFLLCMVGVFPDFRIARSYHQIGAEGGILMAFIWILTTSLWFISLPSILGIFLLYKRKPKNHTWWIECIAYCTLLVAVLIKVLSV